MRRPAFLPLVLFCVVCLASPAVAGSIILNGSFESFTAVFPDRHHDIGISPGSSAITDWFVGGAGVDLIRWPYWDVEYGTYAIDLSWGSPGTIQQSFATVAGQTYQVSFALSGNVEGGPPLKQVKASVDAFTGTYTFDSTGQSSTALVWTPVTFAFVASGSTAMLKFESLTSSAYGPLLDNVSVTESVPDPGSTLLLLGLGLTGLSACRRRWR